MNATRTTPFGLALLCACTPTKTDPAIAQVPPTQSTLVKAAPHNEQPSCSATVTRAVEALTLGHKAKLDGGYPDVTEESIERSTGFIMSPMFPIEASWSSGEISPQCGVVFYIHEYRSVSASTTRRSISGAVARIVVDLTQGAAVLERDLKTAGGGSHAFGRQSLPAARQQAILDFTMGNVPPREALAAYVDWTKRAGPMATTLWTRHPRFRNWLLCPVPEVWDQLATEHRGPGRDESCPQ